MKLPDLVDTVSGRELIDKVQCSLEKKQITGFRSPPPEPSTCCGRGCNGCVWEGYFTALAYWRDEALDVIRAAV
jgi:hypothetical protein